MTSTHPRGVPPILIEACGGGMNTDTVAIQRMSAMDVVIALRFGQDIGV